MKVHVWGGISLRGRTGICIFEGTKDGSLYIQILDQTLLPFIADVYPDGHRFMADNDPKHTSGVAHGFLEEKQVYRWRTPAESPDTNPIENLWYELKEYIRRVVKPTSKQELVEGIKEFWRTDDTAKCQKYIRHLHKVIPKTIVLASNNVDISSTSPLFLW